MSLDFVLLLLHLHGREENSALEFPLVRRKAFRGREEVPFSKCNIAGDISSFKRNEVVSRLCCFSFCLFCYVPLLSLVKHVLWHYKNLKDP